AVVPSAAPAAVPFADEAVRPKQASEADMEKARQALREKMGQIEQKAETTEVMKPVVPEAVTTEEKEVKKAEKPKPAVKSKNAMAWTPLPAPATGLSPAKEQKLQALLDDYKADKLTPEQYHEERAKILGEP
ncbi:MAG TPA: hypothetical protein VK327_04920, partial [Candidatus Paceibacterota bacterium]|nr:hypothetical protein [Candidatus Paceibacterota bacterium]